MIYSHIPVMKQLVYYFDKWHYRMCCVYLLDSVFVTDATKFASGILCCLSGMIQLELPHINVLTKIDLLDKKDANNVSKLCDPDLQSLQNQMEQESKEDDNDKHKLLTCSIAQLLKSFNMVSFLPYSKNDVDSIEMVLSHVDHCIQFGEDQEPQDPSTWDGNQQDDQQEFLFNKQKEHLSQNKDITDID